MSDPNQDQLHSHWAALAEQLGLPPEPPPPTPAPSPAVPAETASIAETAEAPEVETGHEATAELEAPGEAPSGSQRQPDEEWQEPAQPEGAQTDTARNEEEDKGPVCDTEMTAVEEEPAPAGRRRGRRSGRGRATRKGRAAENEQTAQPASEGAETEAEPSRRRGRGRGRGKTAKSRRAAPEAGPAPEAEPPETAPGPEEKDEELDNLSDWNVPSWAELIASLYRPER